MRRRSMVLMTSTLCSRNGSSDGWILEKEIRRLFQPSAGIEQNLFTRDFDPHAEIVVRLQILAQPCRQNDAH